MLSATLWPMCKKGMKQHSGKFFRSWWPQSLAQTYWQSLSVLFFCCFARGFLECIGQTPENIERGLTQKQKSRRFFCSYKCLLFPRWGSPGQFEPEASWEQDPLPLCPVLNSFLQQCLNLGNILKGLWQFSTVFYCDISTLWQFSIVTLRPCDIFLLWHSDSVTIFYCDILIKSEQIVCPP